MPLIISVYSSCHLVANGWKLMEMEIIGVPIYWTSGKEALMELLL